MITTSTLDKPSWIATTFALEGSVMKMIVPRILFFCGLTLVVTIFYTQGFPIYFQKLGDLTSNVIYNLILGLLVVFRTNTSYDRFWEGRKAWGTLVVNIRSLAQEIQLGVSEAQETDRSEKRAALGLLLAFAIASKHYLRGEKVTDNLEGAISSDQVVKLENSSSPPLVIIFWIRRYLQQQLEKGNIRESQVVSGNETLNRLIEGISGCERISTTPIPIAYRIYLKRLIVIYCIGLPFKIIPELTWWSLPLIAVVSFLLLGIEEVGRELENPFGYTANDLPLDDICITIQKNIEQTLTELS